MKAEWSSRGMRRGRWVYTCMCDCEWVWVCLWLCMGGCKWVWVWVGGCSVSHNRQRLASPGSWTSDFYKTPWLHMHGMHYYVMACMCTCVSKRVYTCACSCVHVHIMNACCASASVKAQDNVNFTIWYHSKVKTCRHHPTWPWPACWAVPRSLIFMHCIYQHLVSG